MEYLPDTERFLPQPVIETADRHTEVIAQYAILSSFPLCAGQASPGEIDDLARIGAVFIEPIGRDTVEDISKLPPAYQSKIRIISTNVTQAEL
jgi:hypothetical protein